MTGQRETIRRQAASIRSLLNAFENRWDQITAEVFHRLDLHYIENSLESADNNLESVVNHLQMMSEPRS